MKAKTLNILRTAKDIVSWICILSLVIEVILLSLFSEIAAENPGGVLDILFKTLTRVFLFSLLIVVLPILPEEKNPKQVHPKNQSKKSKEWRKFTFRVSEFPLRFLVFSIIGFLAGVYLFSSFIFFEKIAEINQRVRMILLFFGIFYPLASFLIFFIKEYIVMNTFNFLQKVLGIKVEKKTNELQEGYNEVDEGVAMAFDVMMYYFGGFVGWCLCLLVMFIILLPIGIFWMVKGSIWLIQNPNPWGILAIAILLLAFLAFFIYIKWRDFNDFLDSLSFFPDSKI